jgi:hypothetical protein
VGKITPSEPQDLSDKLADGVRSTVDISKTAEKIKKVVFKF